MKPIDLLYDDKDDMLSSGLCSNSKSHLSETQFYSLYSWCLNPILSLRDLFQRLQEELDRYGQLGVGWQREESKINLCLFICAIACTVDDYLAWRPWNISSISGSFPRLRFAVLLVQWLLNLPHQLRDLFCQRPIIRWRRKWGRVVDLVCEILASESDPAPSQWIDLQITLRVLVNTSLPGRLLRQRMRLPEGFRCQDLTHQDILSLVRRFLAFHPDRSCRLFVIGARTAGAYFAPMVKAYLSSLGAGFVSWITIRPKIGLSRWEKQRLQLLRVKGAHVILVDDHPNTGQTFQLMIKILRQYGVQPERITIIAPCHPAQRGWINSLEKDVKEGVTVITLELGECHKARLLEPTSVEPLFREYYRDQGWEDVHIRENDQVDKINSQLWQHYEDGFHVRLKRVFEVRLNKGNQEHDVEYVFAKGVGWGWLSYHAYIVGARLAGSVPKVIGLRNGLLFSEWLGGMGQPQDHILPKGNMVKTLSSYIAKRVKLLRLEEDPCYGSPDYRWAGWNEVVNFLRGVYGPYVSRLKNPALRRQLGRYVSPLPVLVDGRMRPDEWIETKTGIYKLDFEQHNFGGGELDIVDPAYDLAAAIFEFKLSEEAELELLRSYAVETKDTAISERMLLYKLLYGILTMRQVAQKLAREPLGQQQEKLNERYMSARTFLVCQMNRFCASLLKKPQPAKWSRHLFFLDLDGVLDRECFGFPHTTISGIAALDLLHSHGFSVVLNTGRSVGHIRNYCQTYGFSGGLAEYGSVFVDAVRQRDLVLISAEAAEQLLRCRGAIKKIRDVYVDPEYEFSVRAYRYNGQRTVGLCGSEVENLLARCECDRLTYILRSDDTYIVQKGTGKGPGLIVVKSYLACTDEQIVAVGDSDQDLEMLEMADFSYAPANCSRKVHELSKDAKCRIMDHPFQRGLLEAVLDVTRCGPHNYMWDTRELVCTKPSGDLIQVLLQVADRPWYRQFMAILKCHDL